MIVMAMKVKHLCLWMTIGGLQTGFQFRLQKKLQQLISLRGTPRWMRVHLR
jgi:hypothetical protein